MDSRMPGQQGRSAATPSSSPFYRSGSGLEEFRGKRFMSLDLFHAVPDRAGSIWARLWSRTETQALLVAVGTMPALLALLLNAMIDFGFAVRGKVLSEGGAAALLAFSSAAAWLAAAMVHVARCPEAAGSGVPEMKTALSGVISMEYFSAKVLFVKILGLTAAFSAGLSIGREGPLIHMACILTHLLVSLPLFARTRRNNNALLDIFAAACAAGVAATFGTPFGGTLFSIEITSTFFMLRNLPRAFFAAVCGSIVVYLLSAQASAEELSLFMVPNAPVTRHSAVDVGLLALLGVVCGFVGSFFVWVVSLCLRLRDAISALAKRPGRWWVLWLFIAGPAFLITGAGLLDLFVLRTTADARLQVDQYIFQDRTFAAAGLSPPLLLYAPLKLIFTALSITLPIPAGLFTPVFIMGGAFGRLYAEFCQQCVAIDTQLAPWEFAIVGAAAMASGVTRTISTAVIVLELTGRHELVLPMGVAIVASYAICSTFWRVGIFDFLVMDRGVPHLPEFPQRVHHTLASDVMQPVHEVEGRTTVLDGSDRHTDYTGTGLRFLTLGAGARELQYVLSDPRMLQTSGGPACPLVRSTADMTLLGVVSRREIEAALFALEAEERGNHRQLGARVAHNARAPLLNGAQPQEMHAYGSCDNTVSGSAINRGAARIEFVSHAGGETCVLGGNTFAPSPTDAHIASLRLAVDVAPFQMVDSAPLHKVELVFRMLKVNHIFLTRYGALVGVLTRARLMDFLSERVRDIPVGESTGPRHAAARAEALARELGTLASLNGRKNMIGTI